MSSHDPEGAVREYLRGAATSAGTADIDLPHVLGRVRSRRRTRRIAVAGTSTLAVAAIATAGISTGLFRPAAENPGIAAGEPAPGTAAGPIDGPAAGGAAAGGAIQLAPAEKINPCGAPLADLAPAMSGLVATVAFPATAPAGGAVSGTVVLTNTGSEHLTGYTGARPVMTVSADGITVWHSNGPIIMSAIVIDLQPGASMELPASFDPIRCDEEDEMQQSFRTDLPALEPGAYGLSAVVRWTPDGAAAGYVEDVGGPLATITLE
ncbi:MAG: hypothetical protein JWP66_113 [Naasia sp.]|nr:hypothetical protein [Naasia sp.]